MLMTIGYHSPICYLQYIKIWNMYNFLFLSNNKLKLAYADNIG